MNPTAINPLTLPSLPLASRSALPSYAAIYFVLECDRILYIGRSTNLQQRWMAHHRYSQLSSESRIAWLECSEPELLPEIEKALIGHFRPILNRLNNSLDESASVHVVIPETLKKEFKATCVMEGRNMSEVVVKLIQRWMEEQGKGGKAQPAQPTLPPDYDPDKMF